MAGDELASIIKRFAESECSWLSTVRPDARAHAVPIWHVWHRGRVYVVAATRSVKVRNIARNPDVVITHPDPMESIILEGTARLVEGLTDVLRPLFEPAREKGLLRDGIDLPTLLDWTSRITISYMTTPSLRIEDEEEMREVHEHARAVRERMLECKVEVQVDEDRVATALRTAGFPVANAAQGYVEAFQRSGRTRTDFAVLWGVSLATLSKWVQRYASTRWQVMACSSRAPKV